MTDTRPYTIHTNKMGRRILTILKYFNLDERDDLHEEDFDIVFIDTPTLNYNAVRYLLAKTSPLISGKCRMKPRFMTVFNRNDFTSLTPLIDGFAQSSLDDDVSARAEDILRNIENLHLMHIHHGEVNSENDFFIGLCRYCLSRGRLSFTASTVPSLQEGLSAVYSAYVDIHETVACGNNPDDKNLREMVSQLLEAGYVKPTKFVERIHLCPKCHSGMLLFSECCHKCNSSNLTQEDMIHHFRCATIAPESEYQYEGELKCPKCKRILQHIGIDYDRPAKIYSCNECGYTQMHSAMKVICAVCGHSTRPRELEPYDIREYTFTPEGIEHFCDRES